MAAITACTWATLVTHCSLVQKAPVVRASPVVLGLPVMPRVGKVKCSMEKKTGLGGASLIGAATAAAMSSPAAMALVDERLSTEGTGLPFGLSNNLLGWILFGMFGLIWSLYFVYTSGLEEDEESGLSL